MGDYLALLWDGDDPEAAADAGALEAMLAATGAWTPTHHGRDAWIAARGPAPPRLHQAGALRILGTCLVQGETRPYAPAEPPPWAMPEDLAARLSREAWGAYVALLGPDAVFRDPSGGLDALTWRWGRVRVVTSDAGAPPPRLLPRTCGLDWRVIAGWCRDSSSGAAEAGLSGIHVVGPGSLVAGAGETPTSRLIWRPGRFAARPDPPDREIGDGVRHAVGLAVRGLLAPHERVIQEISGGLDSAVVAASLVEAGLSPRVACALNTYGDRPEGDERAYARAIAGHLGLPLTCVGKPLTPLTEADLAEAARGLRPGFAAVDPVRDRDTAARLRSARATALVTGHGGDVVFFQMPTPAVAADQRRRHGLKGLTVPFLEEVARLTRQPAWRVLQAAFGRHRDLVGSRPPGFGVAAPEAPAWTDPWTADAADAPPAKRLQIRGLHRAHVAMGWSRRGEAADIVHPLLSQPVMEYCLGLSTPALTRTGRDRVVARDAFRGRLPDLVIDRRSKGDLTAHYGRVLAASLDLLRPLLLDGNLVAAGLLDRARLDAALAPDRLIVARANSEILVAATIESWVRWWQTRVPDAAHGIRPNG